MASKRWAPLEANPEVMADYSKKLGLEKGVQFADILATEDWALEMVPQPIVAVILLFQMSENTEKLRKEQGEKIEAGEAREVSKRVWFSFQTVGNACGTMALLHAIGNVKDKCTFQKDSFLEGLFHSTDGKTPTEKAEALESDTKLEEAHKEAESQGQSALPEGKVTEHFAAFAEVDGDIYELDGRKKGPINHGPAGGNFGMTCMKIIRENFMNLDPTELRFAIIAVSAESS